MERQRARPTSSFEKVLSEKCILVHIFSNCLFERNITMCKPYLVLAPVPVLCPFRRRKIHHDRVVSSGLLCLHSSKHRFTLGDILE